MWKFLRICLLCVLLLSTVFISVSFGSMSNSTRQHLTNCVYKLYQKDVINETCYNNLINWFDFDGNSPLFNYNADGDNFIIFIGKGTRFNGGSGNYWSKLNTNNCIYILCPRYDLPNNTVINNNVGTSNLNYQCWKSFYSTCRVFKLDGTQVANQVPSGIPFNDALDGFYCYAYNCNINTRLLTLASGEEVGGNYLNDKLTFTPNQNTTIDVNVNGQNMQFLRYPLSYTISNLRLGNFRNFDKLKDTDVLRIKLGSILNSDTINYLDYQFIYDKNGTYTKGGLFVDSSGALTVPTSNLYTMQGYTLDITLNNEYINNGNSSYNIYMVPYDSNVTSGDVWNPENSLDVGTNQILINTLTKDIEESNSNVNYISSQLISGEFFSGDFLGFHYNSYDNWGLGNYLYNTSTNLLNALLSYEDVTLNFGFLGNIDSSQFIMPNTGFTVMLSLFVNSLLAIGIVVYFFRFINALSTFDFQHFSQYDLDDIIFF